MSIIVLETEASMHTYEPQQERWSAMRQRANMHRQHCGGHDRREQNHVKRQTPALLSLRHQATLMRRSRGSDHVYITVHGRNTTDR